MPFIWRVLSSVGTLSFAVCSAQHAPAQGNAAWGCTVTPGVGAMPRGPMAQWGQQQGLLLGSSCIFGTWFSHPLLEPFTGAPPLSEAALPPLTCLPAAQRKPGSPCVLPVPLEMRSLGQCGAWRGQSQAAAVTSVQCPLCCPWDSGPCRDHRMPEAVQVAAHHARAGKSRQ